MATRSLIGVENADGTVTSIYCHSDGYLRGVGKTLTTHYTDPAKIAALIALGDLSSLGPEIGQKHDFNNPRPGYEWCRAYGRDRGEEDVDAVISKNREEFRSRDMGGEYFYLWSNGQWLFVKYDEENFSPVPV